MKKSADFAYFLMIPLSQGSRNSGKLPNFGSFEIFVFGQNGSFLIVFGKKNLDF